MGQKLGGTMRNKLFFLFIFYIFGRDFVCRKICHYYQCCNTYNGVSDNNPVKLKPMR